MKIEIPAMTYEEALETYNAFAKAAGVEPKTQGDFITVNELIDVEGAFWKKVGWGLGFFCTPQIYGDLYGYGPIILDPKES